MSRAFRARPQALYERLERKTGPAAATRRKPTSENASDAEPANAKSRTARGSASAAGASEAESSAQRQADAQEAIGALTSDGSERLVGARAAEVVMRAARAESGSSASQQLAFVQRALERARALGGALEQRTRGVGELRSQWASLHARACRQAIGRRRTLAIYDQRCARHLVKENCYEHMRRLTAAIGAVRDCSRRAPSRLWVLDEVRLWRACASRLNARARSQVHEDYVARCREPVAARARGLVHLRDARQDLEPALSGGARRPRGAKNPRPEMSAAEAEAPEAVRASGSSSRAPRGRGRADYPSGRRRRRAR